MTALEEYADAVLTGKINACKRLKQQYRKLADKIEHPAKYAPYIFAPDVADEHIIFIETFCKQSQGKLGAPIRLQLFQKAKFQAVFGFIDSTTGLRQYNEVLTIEGRKNGKTTEAACVELDLLVNDNEGSPEIYNVATKKDQANKGFDECWKMVQQSKALKRIIRKRMSDLYCTYNMGKIQSLGSENLDSLNSHGIILDELEAIKKRSIYDDMKQSTSSRDQALLYAICTNGFVRDCIFDSQYKYACDVLDEKIVDEHFLAFIHELDDLNEYKDEKCWIKANPGLGAIKKIETLRQYVHKAEVDPSFLPTVLVKDFNMKQNAASAWLRYEELNNEEMYDIAFDYGVGGMDAADSVDLSAAKAVFMRAGDDKMYVKSMYWIPQAVLDADAAQGRVEGRDAAPYELWIKQGYMRAHEGNKVPKSVFYDWFIELEEEGYVMRYIGYDPWHIDDDLIERFNRHFGASCMIPIIQGAKTLSQPMKDLRADLAAKKIVYNDNPIDKMCLLNTEVRADINGNIQPVKGLNPKKRIDGAMALIDAYIVMEDHKTEMQNMNEEA